MNCYGAQLCSCHKPTLAPLLSSFISILYSLYTWSRWLLGRMTQIFTFFGPGGLRGLIILGCPQFSSDKESPSSHTSPPFLHGVAAIPLGWTTSDDGIASFSICWFGDTRDTKWSRVNLNFQIMKSWLCSLVKAPLPLYPDRLRLCSRKEAFIKGFVSN